MHSTHIPKAPAYWSRAAIVPGIVAIGPMLPGTLAFGMAFGALCAQKNFSLAEVVVMMGTVYGGLSQFVAVQSWPAVLTPATIAVRHILRNALLPVTTLAGMHFGGALGGAVVVETVYSLPGLGRLAFEAVMRRDFNVLLGVLLLSSLLVIFVNMAVDLIQAWLDPRIEVR